jgi:hypothetical protein
MMTLLAGHVLSMCLFRFAATLKVVGNPCDNHNHCETDDDEIAAFPELGIHHGPNRATQFDAEPHPLLRNGLVYVKQPKIGGSTFGGIMRRIAYRHGLRHAQDSDSWLPGALTHHEGSDSVLANHATRRQLGAAGVDSLMPNGIFVTMVRDPVAKAMSAFYHFKVGRAGMEPSVANKVSFLDSVSVSNQFKYVRKGWNPEVSDILSSYHLITVTERFDESLLVLCKSLNVSMVDVLYLKSKESGKAGTGKADFGATMVSHVPLTQEPNEVQRAAARLHDGNTPDNMLLKFANSALDRHVANYGNTFTLDLQQFRRMLATVETACRSHFSESCLWNDNGCGQACIDSLAMQEGWS